MKLLLLLCTFGMVVYLNTPILSVNEDFLEKDIQVLSCDEIQNLETENIEPDPTELIIQEAQGKIYDISVIEDKEQWFIAYKKIIEEYRDVIDPPPTVYDYYTDEEIYLIQRAVETECYDQYFMSKCNVADTIFSRYWDGRFGDTIQEIITNPNQFVYGRQNITDSTILAVEYAFMFETDYEGSLYFQSGGYMETFNKAAYMGFDGCHYFYK